MAEIQITISDLGFPVTSLVVQYSVNEAGEPVQGDMIRTVEPDSFRYINEMMQHPRFRTSVDAGLKAALQTKNNGNVIHSRKERKSRGQAQRSVEQEN